MTAKSKKLYSTPTEYTATIKRSPAPATHKDVTESTQSHVSKDDHFVAPKQLDENQKKYVEECAAFLSADKINVLRTNITGGILGLPGFTVDEEKASRTKAGRFGVSLT